MGSRPFIERPPRFGTRKPTQHSAVMDRSAPLSAGLLSCIAFDICAQAGTIRDFAAPTQRFTWHGTAQSQAASLFGGGAALTPVASTTDYLTYNNPLSSTSSWSASYMSKFDGTGPGAGVNAPFCNTANTAGIALSTGATNQYVDLATGSATWTPPATTFTTWTRHSWTSNGTTVSFYSNGTFQSSQPIAINFSLGAIISGWPWAMSDFFFWNRSLSAREVANHNAAPFAVLKPRYTERWWLTAGNCQPLRPESSDFSTIFGPFTSSCGGTKPSLLTTGVGS